MPWDAESAIGGAERGSNWSRRTKVRAFPSPWNAVAISLTLILGLCVYVAFTCSRPPERRPLYGYFQVHYTWDKGITKADVIPLIPAWEPTDPLSRTLATRMARGATEKRFVEQMRLVGVVHGSADAYVTVYGDIFPCCAGRGGMMHLTDWDRPEQFNQ